MIKSLIAAITFLAVIFVCAGCAVPLRSPVLGGIYTGVEASETVSGSAVGQKTGKACAMSILGLVAIGDASTDTAAKNGGITQISYVDEDMTGILGIYAQHCAVVHGN